MNSHLTSSVNRTIAAAVVVALLAAGCGGGDDDSASTATAAPQVTEAATTTTPPVTEPPATESPVSEPPVSDAPVTEPPVTDPPAPLPAGDAADTAFCDASVAFYLPSRALDFVATEDGAAARELFSRMEASLPAAIATAPDAERAAAPQRVAELFASLLPALESVDYDLTRLDTLDNNDEVQEVLLEIGSIFLALESYLADECALAIDVLDAEAEVIAAEVTSAGFETRRAAPASTSITDESGKISVDVPIEWSDVDGSPDRELRQLAAAADVSSFLEGYTEQGVFIISGDSDDPDTEWRGQLDGALESAQRDGCTIEEAAPYDDGVYAGTENVLSCAGSDLTIRAIAGADAEQTVWFFVGLAHPAGATEYRDLIVESFFVD